MIRTFLRIAMLVVAIAACAIPALADRGRRYSFEDLKAWQVIGGLAVSAHEHADDANKQGPSIQGYLWQAWADRFMFDKKHVNQSMTARQLFSSAIAMDQRLAALYTAARKPAYAQFYSAFVIMLQDLEAQLQRGPIINPKLPRQMLLVLDDAPGTPWERSYVYTTLPTTWNSMAKPGQGEKVCPTCNGARQFRCTNCLGSGQASTIKPWTGDPLASGRNLFLGHSCYPCDGTGWIRCRTCNGRGVVAAR